MHWIYRYCCAKQFHRRDVVFHPSITNLSTRIFLELVRSLPRGEHRYGSSLNVTSQSGILLVTVCPPQMGDSACHVWDPMSRAGVTDSSMDLVLIATVPFAYPSQLFHRFVPCEKNKTVTEYAGRPGTRVRDRAVDKHIPFPLLRDPKDN